MEELCTGVYNIVSSDYIAATLDLMIKQSRLPHSLYWLGYSSFEIRGKDDVERQSLEDAYTAAMAMAQRRLDPPFLYLYGTTGLGKTHLAYAVGWSYISMWETVAYYQVAELLIALRGSYGDNSFDRFMKRLEDVSLLILDDIGVQQDTPWERETLDTIVDYRYRNRKAMLATANTLEISERILDRFKPNIVRLRGESYRGNQ